MAQSYLVAHVQKWPTPAGMVLKPGDVTMRFDQAMHTIHQQLACWRPDRTPNPNPITPQWNVVEVFGNFAVVTLVVPDGWWTKYKDSQAGIEAVQNTFDIGGSKGALTSKARTVVNAIGAAMDQVGMPAAATPFQRAVDNLQALEFEGHDGRFNIIRNAYLGALTDPPTPEAPEKHHHWLPRFIVPGPPLADGTTNFDFDAFNTMYAEMQAHPITDPCRSMHYIYQMGYLGLYLSR